MEKKINTFLGVKHIMAHLRYVKSNEVFGQSEMPVWKTTNGTLKCDLMGGRVVVDSTHYHRWL